MLERNCRQFDPLNFNTNLPVKMNCELTIHFRTYFFRSILVREIARKPSWKMITFTLEDCCRLVAFHIMLWTLFRAYKLVASLMFILFLICILTKHRTQYASAKKFYKLNKWFVMHILAAVFNNLWPILTHLLPMLRYLNRWRKIHEKVDINSLHS